MIDFPTPSTVGQVFDPGTGVVYQWDGVAWNVVAVPGNATARRPNLITNPTAWISQENGRNVMTANGAYVADNWLVGGSGLSISAASFSGRNPPSPEGTTYGVDFNASVAKPALASNDFIILQQWVESADATQLNWGNAYAKQVVVRFSARINIGGTFGFCIRNGGNYNRTYLTSFTLPSSTWTPIVLAIPGDTTGTWGDLVIGIAHSAGSSLVGPGSGWYAGGMIAPPGCSNGAATATNNMTITDLGFYADPDKTGAAPPWEPPVYDTDQSRCRRYYQMLNPVETTKADAQSQMMTSLFTPMRVVPTLSKAGGDGGWAMLSNGVVRQSAAATVFSAPTLYFNARMG